MPVFDITAPDGTHYEVTGPEGSTEQEALQQVQAQHGQPQAATAVASAPPTLKQQLATSIPVRMARGMMDPVMGGIQAIAHGVSLLPGADQQPVQQIDQGLQRGQQMYEADRKATGQTGMDLARLGGNILSPVNYAIPDIGPASTLGKIAFGAATGGALGGLQPVFNGGQDFAKQKAIQVGLGAAGGAIVPTIGAAYRGAKKLLPQILGGTTGTGANAVQGAFDAGAAGGEQAKAFTDSMRGNTPMDEVVAQAKDALANMRADRNAAYRSGMSDISKDATILDFAPIDEALSKADSIKNFKGIDTSPKTADVRTEITGIIDKWKALDPAEYHTPEGFDALKQMIGDVRDNLPYNTPQRAVADQAYSAVRKTISDQAPAYNRVMADYSRASEEVSAIQRELSLGPKGNPGTALRKLQSVMRDNVNTSWGARAAMANKLSDAGASTLIPALAGQSMNATLPRGMARVIDSGLVGVGAYTNPATLAALPLASPRAVGELAYGAGSLAQGATALSNMPIIRALPRLPAGAFGAAAPNLFLNPAINGAH